MSKQKYPQNNTTSVTSTGTPRKGREHYSQIKAHAKQDRKRHEAYARQDKYDSLTIQAKIDSCVPGGSKRQRDRLAALVAANVELTKNETSTVPHKTKSKVKR